MNELNVIVPEALNEIINNAILYFEARWHKKPAAILLPAYWYLAFKLGLKEKFFHCVRESGEIDGDLIYSGVPIRPFDGFVLSYEIPKDLAKYVAKEQRELLS